MTPLQIVLFLFIASLASKTGFLGAHAAVQCYSCNPCGTTWNPGVATVIQTSTPNDYCRKTVSGSLVVKDSATVCTGINFPNNGVYCCQTDFCNSSSHSSLKMIYLIFAMICLRCIY